MKTTMYAQFLFILFWEALENAPVLIGFILAIRFWAENTWLALVCLLLGAALGAGLIHFTETKKFSNQPSLKETLTNFCVFTIIPLPVLFYLSIDGIWRTSWVTDILLGIVAGSMIAIGESWGWKDTASVRVHGVSMAIAAVLFLFGIRFTRQIDLWVAIGIIGLAFNLFVSVIIVWLDYWPVRPAPHQLGDGQEDRTVKSNDYANAGGSE